MRLAFIPTIRPTCISDHSGMHHDHGQMLAAHTDSPEHDHDHDHGGHDTPGHDHGHGQGHDMHNMMSMVVRIIRSSCTPPPPSTSFWLFSFPLLTQQFHFGYKEVILFEQWSTDSVIGLIGSVLVIMLMAACYEGLKYYREYLFWKTYNSLQYRAVTLPEKTGVVGASNDDNTRVQ